MVPATALSAYCKQPFPRCFTLLWASREWGKSVWPYTEPVDGPQITLSAESCRRSRQQGLENSIKYGRVKCQFAHIIEQSLRASSNPLPGPTGLSTRGAKQVNLQWETFEHLLDGRWVLEFTVNCVRDWRHHTARFQSGSTLPGWRDSEDRHRWLQGKEKQWQHIFLQM